MATKTTGFRFRPEVLEHLDTLCEISGVSRSEYLTAAIEADWDKYQGNPKMQALLEQFQTMKRQMLDFVGQLPDGQALAPRQIGE